MHSPLSKLRLSAWKVSGGGCGETRPVARGDGGGSRRQDSFSLGFLPSSLACVGCSPAAPLLLPYCSPIALMLPQGPP